jgi:hypothetical protein
MLREFVRVWSIRSAVFAAAYCQTCECNACNFTCTCIRPCTFVFVFSACLCCPQPHPGPVAEKFLQAKAVQGGMGLDLTAIQGRFKGDLAVM